MEFTIRHIDYQVDQYAITKAFAEILHSETFWKYPDYDNRPENLKPLNFKITLNASVHGGVRNDGTGTVTVHHRRVGQELLKWQDEEGPIRVLGKKIKIFPKSGPPPSRGLSTPSILEKTPYIDPDIDRERNGVLQRLVDAIRIYRIQIGVFHRVSGTQGRQFSVEWERNHDNCPGWLRFEYDHKLIRMQFGDRMIDELGQNIVVQFSNIVKCGIGYDFGNPYICFELITPAIFQEENFNRQLTMDEKKDGKKFRRRVGSLHPGHAVVAPYAHQLRILLYEPKDITRFVAFCEISGLRKPISAPIDAAARGFFCTKQLHRFQAWISEMKWPAAFQVAALLHNGLLHTEHLLTDLYDPIRRLCQENESEAGDILRRFAERLQSSFSQINPRQCLDEIVKEKRSASLKSMSSGMFQCYHVTFAPTRMLLEGPSPSQSNRVLRRYEHYAEHFIRADFRDEDKLQYHWARDVNGASFVQERVGGILKNGFDLAGRHFEFLAYSTSALRSHQVWFVNPFDDPDLGLVKASMIRSSLGDFSGVISQPSKYGARMAQAFTGTDPSNVRISREQWEEVPDLGMKPYLHTDGVGTISKELGDMIWEKLCQDRHDHGLHAIRPSAYQIRFLGYKGVVCIDPELEGVKMRLRPSMNKFRGNEIEYPEIEIARAFDHPTQCYLNRALVKVLEDLGIKIAAFEELQQTAIAEAIMISDSLENFSSVLHHQHLGDSHHLSGIMDRLGKQGMDLKHANRHPEKTIDDPFLYRVCHIAKNDILRDLKHGARILVPDAYVLVGVADEGPAYEAAGYKNVFSLKEGQIFVCVQNPGDPTPTWRKGPCAISRSPVTHPGDVQRVYAIGEPPKDQLCLFRNSKNVVVFPSVGERSMPSRLAGGDLDGDVFQVIFYPKLLPTEIEPAANYEAADPHKLGRDSTIDDVCDFIVEYINSDVVGLLSDRHLVIADQSKHGVRDDACLKLSAMCSAAVDYAKNGTPVNIDDMPRFLFSYKPDWHAAEKADANALDYYRSDKALGKLFRAIKEDPLAPVDSSAEVALRSPLTDTISMCLKPKIKRLLRPYSDPTGESPEIEELFREYKVEMLYIASMHTLVNAAGNILSEEEIVVGTILAKCSERRWRKDRMSRMRLHASTLVRGISRKLLPESQAPTLADLRRAWEAWDYSQRYKDVFGGNGFGLVALSAILDCLDKLDSGPSPAKVDTTTDNDLPPLPEGWELPKQRGAAKYANKKKNQRGRGRP